jgi:DNA-binding NtrC family response regulator
VVIPALAEHLLRRLSERYQLEYAALMPDALAALMSHQWPGNVRELENVLARALALRTGSTITRRDLPPPLAAIAPVGPGAALFEENPTLTLEDLERRYILRVLEATRGNKLKAAAILGIDRSTLHRKLKQMQSLPAIPLHS